jgi:uncharacterized protein
VNPKRVQQLSLILLLAILASPALAAEPKFPALTGRVVDNAGILDASTTSQLTNMLADHERATGQQVVVVTLNSLQGFSIEDYGYQLGRYWGIGQKGKNTGVLLIVAPIEHKVRIEVGYGLEGTLTDAICATIIQSYILPNFKRGDFNAGVVAGTTSILQALGGNPPQESAPNTTGVPPVVAVLLWAVLIFTLPMIILFLRALLTGHVRQLDGYGRDSDGRYVGGSFSAGGGGGFSGGGGGFSGGGGSFGGGGASGSW